MKTPLKYKIQLNDGFGWFNDRVLNYQGLYEIDYFISIKSAFAHISEYYEFYEDKHLRIVPENIPEEWSPYEKQLIAENYI